MLEDVLPKQFAFKIMKISFNSNDNFQCEIRVKIQTKVDFQKWFEEFKRITHTSWGTRKSRCTEKSRFTLSKNYVCHHSSYRKIKVSSKNKNCTASLKVRVKRNSKHVRYRDRLAKEGYFTIIKIDFNHSHKINPDEAWNWLPRTAETKEIFIDLFESGMSPAAAKNYHESYLLVDTPPDELANSSINPPIRYVYAMYQKWSRENDVLNSRPDFQKVIEKKISACKELGCDLEVQENPFTVVILTPLMIRMISTLDGSYSVFVDSTQLHDQAKSLITVISVATDAGAVPIGIAVHKCQTEENFTVVFSLLKKAWYKIRPFQIENFLTDDCEAVKAALRNEFPTERQLLSIFNVRLVFWRWLWNSRSEIDKSDRRTIMSLFCNIVNSSTLFEFNENVEHFCNSDVTNRYGNLVHYISLFLQRKEEWCLVFRSSGKDKNHDAVNFSEATVRVFKEIVLTRLRVFNPVGLIGFIGNILDKYLSIRLKDIALGRLEKHHILFQDYLDKGEKVLSDCFVESNDDFHTVKPQTKDLTYTIDFGICSCSVGIQGAFCKHLAAVYLKYEANFPCPPSLSSEDKEKFFKIAVGFDKCLSDALSPPVCPETVAEKEASNIEILPSDTITNSNKSITNTSLPVILSSQTVTSNAEVLPVISSSQTVANDKNLSNFSSPVILCSQTVPKINQNLANFSPPLVLCTQTMPNSVKKVTNFSTPVILPKQTVPNNVINLPKFSTPVVLSSETVTNNVCGQYALLDLGNNVLISVQVIENLEEESKKVASQFRDVMNKFGDLIEGAQDKDLLNSARTFIKEAGKVNSVEDVIKMFDTISQYSRPS